MHPYLIINSLQAEEVVAVSKDHNIYIRPLTRSGAYSKVDDFAIMNCYDKISVPFESMDVQQGHVSTAERFFA